MKFIIYLILAIIINYFLFNPYIKCTSFKGFLISIYANMCSVFLLFAMFDCILRLLK